MRSLNGPGAFLLLLVSHLAGFSAHGAAEPGSHGRCSARPHCTCYDLSDDEAPCDEARLFSRLVDWVQQGVDAHVPKADREGLPRIREVLELRRAWHGGRSAFAVRPVHIGELLLRLPLQRLMHAGLYKGAAEVEADLRSSLTEALRRGLQGHEYDYFVAPQTWLALYLMEHRRLGQASPWSAYIDLLPEEFEGVPLFYGKQHWEWLRGSRFEGRVARHGESLLKQFETVAELVPDLSSYSFREFLWARSAISTRVFGWQLPGLDSEDTDFMVPLGDMFNHRSPKQLEWFFNESAGTLDYRAKEYVPEGGELLISYGAKCNSQYLLHYGFAVPNVSSRWPPVSTVRVAMDLDADVPNRKQRESWLLKRRLREEDEQLDPEEFELRSNSFAGAGAMLGYARLLSLEGAEFERRMQGRACKAFGTPPRCEQPLSLANEVAALRRCEAAVAAALAAYPSSPEEDEGLLPTLSGIERNLVMLRHDEKVVLRWWLRFFRLALELSQCPQQEIEERAESAFERFGPEAQYLRVSLAAIVSVEQSARAKSERAARADSAGA